MLADGNEEKLLGGEFCCPNMQSGPHPTLSAYMLANLDVSQVMTKQTPNPMRKKINVKRLQLILHEHSDQTCTRVRAQFNHPPISANGALLSLLLLYCNDCPCVQLIP